MNISTSPEKGSKASVDAADTALRGELARDGWLAGHEVYRTKESQRLHGGEQAGPEGRQYLKDGIVFSINRNRMDEAQLKQVRFPGWQGTAQGEREVKQALRRSLLRYKLHTDQELFEKAYGYIVQYY